MANVNTAFGFHLVEDNSLTPLETCFMSDATATFVGDAVKTAGSAGRIVGGPRKKTVAQCAATDPIYGIVQGFVPYESSSMNLGLRHRPASVSMYVLIKPANHQDIYRIQSDDDSGTLADVDIGLNADIIVGAGNAVTGMSGMQVDTSTKNTTPGLQVKIIGYDDRPSNQATVANQDILVRINQSELGNDAGTTGV